MDTHIRGIFDNVSLCTKSLAEISNAISAAHKSAATLALLRLESQTLLVGARLLRTESLFHALLEPLHSFDAALQIILEQSSAVVSLPAVRAATWNTLPDQWYISRVTGLLDILSTVSNSRKELTIVLEHQAHCGFSDHPSYADLVANAHQAIQNLEIAWNKCLHFVDGWRDIAVSVIGGIGESGSLLPQP